MPKVNCLTCSNLSDCLTLTASEANYCVNGHLYEPEDPLYLYSELVEEEDATEWVD